VHVAEPAVSAKVPAPQGKQVAALLVAEEVPGAQLAQTASLAPPHALCWIWPGPQTLHATQVLTLVE
jgi:hypothetical protein